MAGTDQAVLMVESEAQELPEDVMLGAVVFGHEQMQTVIQAIEELVEAGGKAEWEWTAPEKNTALIDRVHGLAADAMRDAYKLRVKQERSQRIKAIEADVQAQLAADENPPAATDVGDILFELQSGIVRNQILSGEPASMVATPAPCARSPSAPACCHVPTAVRCSPVARRRRWWWPRWVRPATSRSSTQSPASTVSAS